MILFKKFGKGNLKLTNQWLVIEPIKNDNKNVMVTYFSLGSTETDYIMLSGGSDFYGLRFKQLGNTNWSVYPEFEGKLIIDYKKSPRLPLRFYLSVGLYDLGIGRVGANRQLRDILELKSYDVEHHEYNGGHSHVNWRQNLAEGLISLLGKSITDGN